jgi:SAM-dependent methyltransferase
MKSFDRIAHDYDRHRGGEERGRRFAPELDPLFATDGLALEIGVGTGIIAKGLTERGRRVAGIDIGPAMLRYARERIGDRVAAGDATRLPVRTASVDNAYSVWVLHLVDHDAVMREVARVLRPDGRYLVVAGNPEDPASEGQRILRDLQLALRSELPDHPDDIEAAAARNGMRVLPRHRCAPQRFELNPHEQAKRIEERNMSFLWDVAGRDWERVVVPALHALRALPDRPVVHEVRPHVLVLQR